MDITKVPFKKGERRSVLSSRIPLKAKSLKYQITQTPKPLPIEQDLQILEDLELDELHAELLTRNISKGIDRLNPPKKSLLPSLNRSGLSDPPEPRNKSSLQKSSSMPSYSLQDFKTANAFIKQNKGISKPRKSLISPYYHPTDFYTLKFRDSQPGNSFISLGKNTTTDTILGNTGKRQILSRRSKNTSILHSSISGIFRNSQIANSGFWAK